MKKISPASRIFIMFIGLACVFVVVIFFVFPEIQARISLHDVEEQIQLCKSEVNAAGAEKMAECVAHGAMKNHAIKSVSLGVFPSDSKKPALVVRFRDEVWGNAYCHLPEDSVNARCFFLSW